MYEKKKTYYVNEFGEVNNEYSASTLKESSTFYLKRSKENIATKIGFNFKNQAKEYFKDCSIIQELINSKEYRLLSKKELVDQYNVFCTE